MKVISRTADPTELSIPHRSRLYRLKPIGAKTPLVESMTGYVGRLAEAYDVPVQVLFRNELGLYWHDLNCIQLTTQRPSCAAQATPSTGRTISRMTRSSLWIPCWVATTFIFIR